jgi:glycosyltransferase involved in cell wall biosynthesis
MMGSWLVVTPARNEADNLPHLAASLAAQTADVVGLWVVVDDGSTDGTATCVAWDDLPFPTAVIRRDGSASGLARGGAFAAWYAGCDEGLRRLPAAERVLKLDADVVLTPTYLDELHRIPRSVGLIGGVVVETSEREHRHHVRGPLKAYNRAAYEVVRALPAAVGHDVMDEVALRAAGFEVRTIPSAQASLRRGTTTSEGLLQGRIRNGKVTRWTGYHPAYVLLRLLRYAARPPYVVGSLAMLWGYLTAGGSPWSADLRRAHRAEQVARLRLLVRNPLGYLRRSLGLGTAA